MLHLNVTMTPQLIIQICKHTGAQSLITPPPLIEELLWDQTGMEVVKGVTYILWVGNQSIGNALAPFTRLVPATGSTERRLQIFLGADYKSMWNSLSLSQKQGLELSPLVIIYTSCTSIAILKATCSKVFFIHLQTSTKSQYHSFSRL